MYTKSAAFLAEMLLVVRSLPILKYPPFSGHDFPWLVLLLLAGWPVLLPAQDIQYRSVQSRFSLSSKPELNSRRGEWGMYFWEFGDGHYRIVEDKSGDVKYVYREAPGAPVKVYLTPYYTKLDDPVKIEGWPTNLKIDPGTETPVYAWGDNLVHIETSAGSDNLLVPGHRVRVAVHYKTPENINGASPGYLLVFLNPRKTEGFSIGYPPFEWIEGQESLYYEEQFLGSDFTAIQSSLPAGAATPLRNLRLNYRNGYIFKTPALPSGEERRLFFTIQSDERLRHHEAKDRSIDFKAFWVPLNQSFVDADRQTDTYVMRIDSVHDPNRIRVRPKTAYFKRNPSRPLTYIVDFQNEAEGIVQDLEIEVPIPEGLRLNSANVSSKKFEECLTIADTADKQCLVVLPTDDQLLQVKIYNADIAGKEGERRGLFNRHTKGSIEFDIMPSGVKEKRTRTRAEIRFIGAEPIQTNRATVRWRHRGIYLRAGYAFEQIYPDAFDPVDLEFPDQITFGLAYEDAPLGTGIVGGLELSAAQFRFQRDTILTGAAILNNQGLLKLEERSRMMTLDATLKAGYQFSGLLRAYAFGGLSLPAFATTTLDAKAGFDEEFQENRFEDLQDMSFGLFQKQEEVVLLGEPFRSQSGLGWTLGGAVEVGKLDVFAVGLRYSLRRIKIYDGSCHGFQNISAYLRFQLFGGL